MRGCAERVLSNRLGTKRCGSSGGGGPGGHGGGGQLKVCGGDSNRGKAKHLLLG